MGACLEAQTGKIETVGARAEALRRRLAGAESKGGNAAR
jgi:hypothetical protein